MSIHRIKNFGNLIQEILSIYYKFSNANEVIDYLKIELVLEESHIWRKNDEKILINFLKSKKNPLKIEEGVCFSAIKVSST